MGLKNGYCRIGVDCELLESFIHVPPIPAFAPTLSHLQRLGETGLLRDDDIQFYLFSYFYHFFFFKQKVYHQCMGDDYNNQLQKPTANKSRHFLLLQSSNFTKDAYPSYEEFIKNTYFFQHLHEITGEKGIIIPLKQSKKHWVTLVIIVHYDSKEFQPYLIDSKNDDPTVISDKQLEEKYSFDLEALSNTFFNEYNKVDIKVPVFFAQKDDHNSGVFSAFTALSFIIFFQKFKNEKLQKTPLSNEILSEFRSSTIEGYKKTSPRFIIKPNRLKSW